MKLSIFVYLVFVLCLVTQIHAACTCVGSSGIACGATVTAMYQNTTQSREICMTYCLSEGYACCGCNVRSTADWSTVDPDIACFGCPSQTTCRADTSLTMGLTQFCESSTASLLSASMTALTALVFALY
eukprot:TRINITY_DN13614_c0_g1_i1.p1 TRINITY_DN13614_c0_g1~~TRINITY_DN13614_c0_g1_i1.p1  ORF type:complete len:141 (+),score=15.99 TRINITY_DN13614_c0_g1_i1:39-425(+)